VTEVAHAERKAGKADERLARAPRRLARLFNPLCFRMSVEDDAAIAGQFFGQSSIRRASG